MLTMEHNGNKIVLDEPYYRLLDSYVFVGEPSIAKVSSGGHTDIIDTRTDKTGKIHRIGLEIRLVSDDEREIIRDMAIGKNRASVSNPIKIRNTDEYGKTTMYFAVYDETADFYKEVEDKNNIDLDDKNKFYDVQTILLII